VLSWLEREKAEKFLIFSGDLQIYWKQRSVLMIFGQDDFCVRFAVFFCACAALQWGLSLF